MTSFAEDLTTLLEAEPTITAILTGGIYNLDETGYSGITPKKTPGAWTSVGLLKPIAMVKSWLEVATASISDEGAQVQSYRAAIEIRLYQANGYAVLEQAKDAIYAFLHDKSRLGVRFQFAGARPSRQQESLNGASEIVLDYTITGVRYP